MSILKIITSDSTKFFTLDQCIRYALQYQPGLNQSLVNTAIAEANNPINMSGWFPQLNLTGNMVHYTQLPRTVSPNPVPGGAPIVTPTGVANTAIPQLTASQTIFEPQLFYAAKSAPLLHEASRANHGQSWKIYILLICMDLTNRSIMLAFPYA